MFNIINSCLWSITTILIIVFGVYFSKILKYPQLNIKKIIKSLKNTKENISPIKTLYLTLAGRIGVGSIAGVALAIYKGGPGTIFWMWGIALISGSLAYSETILSIKYKNKDYGGPSYYIKKGLQNKKIAIVYSLMVIIAYIIGFIPIQSNTIVKSIDMIINCNHLIIGALISISIFFIINGGITKITEVTNKLVPFMTIIYIFLSLIVIIFNIPDFINVIKLIIIEAFNIKSFFSSFIPMVLIGIQRGIFSNESGIGLGGIAASSSNIKNGCISGYTQVLGIYITTILICTATAFMILIFDYNSIAIENINGIEITSLAFKYHFGNLGDLLLVICILLFSFTTILTGYYYCESSLKFIYEKFNIQKLKIFISISVLLGTISSPTIIWQLVDILVACLSIINIYALYKLKDETFKYHKKYDRI